MRMVINKEEVTPELWAYMGHKFDFDPSAADSVFLKINDAIAYKGVNKLKPTQERGRD